MLQDQLFVLDTMNNNLSGQIPASLGKQTDLSILNLRNNSLSGEIPSSLQYCTELIILDLGYNNFSGTIPEWIGQNLSVLMVLSLRSNAFLGSIPSEIVRLGYLRILDLSHNNLSGTIPRSIGKLSSTALEKGIPKDYIQYLEDESDEGLMGSLYFVVKGETRDYAKLLYLFESIDLSCNNLYGEIPDEIGDLQALQNLNLSMNLLIGHIPDQIGMMHELESLDVAMNNLSGTIPQSLATLNYLSHLNVSYNNLSGKIPSEYQLQTLDDPSIYIGNPYLCGPPTTQSCSINEATSASGSLRNAYFSTIDSMYDRLITQLGYLRALDLSHNNLSGIIPRSIGKLSWKKGVPTDHKLVSKYGSFEVSAGTVYLVIKGEAREYSKLLYLSDGIGIDLSCNHLNGEIPDEIGDLQALHNLNLSMNHLTGHIPDQIGKMHALESLDVAMNMLSGAIPQSLAALNSLSHLNVSYNNLSGKIPSGYQLQTLDDPSIYIGNPYLCGPPTTQSCSTNETIHVFSNGHQDRFERLWLYIGVVLGFIMGFWIFCGVLLLSRSLRNAYFSAIDRTYDRLYVAVALTLIRLRRRCGEM
uniref:Uncharacterized protein n=1 Tax=Ananas comosus var. bracteatus TaxID=296719 RepID=A0A6V7NQ21_ANACO|nr:unnamed protein product [Ananas comosus var. bracteatus]